MLDALLATATGSTVAVVRGVRSEQLGLPTPCAGWDVRRLANHLVHWAGTVSGCAARKQEPPAGVTEETDHTAGDWAAGFAERAGDAARAWAAPEALSGTTVMAGSELPAPLVASLVLGELVLHGWDLAAATGQEYACPPEVAEAVGTMLAQLGAQGRSMGLFAAEVPVPESAGPLARVLALSGRDPAWRAGAPAIAES